MGYQIECEYVNENGRYIKESHCTVYKSEKKAEEELCFRLSYLEAKGCTEVQGSVVEL